MKKAISTDKAPAAIGPYSQAIEVNGMIYTSGVIPVVPSTGEIPEGAAAQADQAIGNLAALLKEAGTSTENVVKTTVFIKNMDKFFEVVDSCKGRVELVTGEGDRLNLKSKLAQYVSLANIFSNGEIPELEIVAYEKEDIDKLMEYMISRND